MGVEYIRFDSIINGIMCIKLCELCYDCENWMLRVLRIIYCKFLVLIPATRL